MEFDARAESWSVRLLPAFFAVQGATARYFATPPLQVADMASLTTSLRLTQVASLQICGADCLAWRCMSTVENLCPLFLGWTKLGVLRLVQTPRQSGSRLFSSTAASLPDGVSQRRTGRQMSRTVVADGRAGRGIHISIFLGPAIRAAGAVARGPHSVTGTKIKCIILCDLDRRARS